MTATADWEDVRTELDRWSAAGRNACLWVRDDDAMAPTPELERLLRLLSRHRLPALLSVIPMRAEPTLPAMIGGFPLVEIAMHGAWHRNHAPVGRALEETAPDRGRSVIVAELADARTRLRDLFGTSAGRWYVPPWHRISARVAELLPDLGFEGLSTFDTMRHGCPRLVERNTHVDLIDWDGGKGRSVEAVARALATALAHARADGARPLGILTHHLEHDETAWSALAALLAVTTGHPAVRWISPSSMLQAGAVSAQSLAADGLLPTGFPQC